MLLVPGQGHYWVYIILHKCRVAEDTCISNIHKYNIITFNQHIYFSNPDVVVYHKNYIISYNGEAIPLSTLQSYFRLLKVILTRPLCPSTTLEAVSRDSSGRPSWISYSRTICRGKVCVRWLRFNILTRIFVYELWTLASATNRYVSSSATLLPAKCKLQNNIQDTSIYTSTTLIIIVAL